MNAGLSNGAIVDLLERHARLLEIAGESPFRRRAYSRAAESLRIHPESIVVVAAEGRLRDIPGIGEGIAAAAGAGMARIAWQGGLNFPSLRCQSSLVSGENLGCKHSGHGT